MSDEVQLIGNILEPTDEGEKGRKENSSASPSPFLRRSEVPETEQQAITPPASPKPKQPVPLQAQPSLSVVVDSNPQTTTTTTTTTTTIQTNTTTSDSPASPTSTSLHRSTSAPPSVVPDVSDENFFFFFKFKIFPTASSNT